MVKIFSDLEELNFFAAETFISIGKSAIELNKRFAVALAGGSTPKSLYNHLASEIFATKIDWTKTFFFFGDERNVFPHSEESNFLMANENLLKPLCINEKNIFRWQTELKNAEKIAEDYQFKLKEFFILGEKQFPRFDLILLGLGDDAHTASLFPFTGALREAKKIAVANPVEKLKTNRLTLTFPVINNAANVLFLISGASKAEAVKKVLRGEFQPDEIPAQNIRLNNGNLYWLIDEQAAMLLEN